MSNQELSLLSSLHEDFYSRGISSIDDGDGIVRGRPYGGLCILWRKSLGPTFSVKTLDDPRLLLCEITNGDHSVALLNVYLPCDNGSNMEDYRFYLSKVECLLAEFPYSAAFGDFNANIKSPNHRFGLELKTFCTSENLVISDSLIADEDTFTFYSEAHDSVAWLDHMVATQNLHSLIDHIWVDYSYVTSDHFPVFVCLTMDEVNPNPSTAASMPSYGGSRVKWENLSIEHIAKYKLLTEISLSNVALNHALILCDDPSCKDVSHISAINTMYRQIVESLVVADNELIKCTSRKQATFKQLP